MYLLSRQFTSGLDWEAMENCATREEFIAFMAEYLADLIETGAMPAMNHYSGVQYTSVPELKEYIQKADLITLQKNARPSTRTWYCTTLF